MSVYFIRFGNRVKVGKSKDPAARLKTLQTGSAFRMVLLAVAEIKSDVESYDIERQIHEQFSWCRGHGEFFSYNRLMREFVAAIASGMPVRKALELSAKPCGKMRKIEDNLAARKLKSPPVYPNSAARRKMARKAAAPQQR